MQQKRGAIALPLNFIVMLTIAIAVFILSLVFLGDFFDKATDLKASMDEKTKVQIEQMLAGNARVAIPIEQRTVKRGEPAQYAIGIKNTITDEYFYVDFKEGTSNDGKFIPADNSPAEILRCNSGSCSTNAGIDAVTYVVSRGGKTTIPINKEDIILVATQANNKAPRGHYIFNIEVCVSDEEISSCNNAERYGDSIQKLHMIVR